MTQRLLLFFSYIGTNYQGVQRTLSRQFKGPDLQSVQGIIEFGLNTILRTDNNAIILSSRTDTGVHAVESTAHFDNKEARVNPRILCQSLNLYLEKNQTDIRLRRILEVPREFSCRSNARSRSYCYRIALLKSNDFENCPGILRLSGALPITELYRCEPVAQPLNISAIYDACKVFLGKWNFRTFATYSEKEEADMEEKDYNKTMLRVSFGKCTNTNIEYTLDRAYEKLDHYEFQIEGSGFLRRQVRKMVGSMLALGSGKVTEKDIKYMLENPSQTSWNNICPLVSSHGLFLKSVNYRDIPVIRV